MKLSNYEIGKTVGEGAFGKVAIKIMNIEKLKEMNANKKKMQEDVDKILLRKARKKIYQDIMQDIAANPALKEENEINLARFVDKVQQETTKAMDFETVPSVTDSLTSFQQEALLMMRFKHPNIIKIYKVFESPDDTFCGTPTYSPPEMISGQPYHGTKIDIWSMGIILYGMVAGNLPFVGDTVSTLFQKIKGVQYEIPEHFSWEITALLKLILVDDSNRRLDMEGLWSSRWVNVGYDYPPERSEPLLTDKEALAKLISSVTLENNITIYNINYHKNAEMAKNIEQFERHRRASTNKNVVKLKQRKSISVESEKSAASSQSSVNVQDSNVSLNRMSCVENAESPSQPVENPAGYAMKRSQSVKEKAPNRHRASIQSNASDIKYKRSSTTDTDLNLKGDSLSREVSVVHRMSKVSDTNDLQLNQQDITEWHLIHKPPPEIHTMKFQFKKGLVSTLDPPSMFQDLHRALIEMKQNFKITIAKPNEYYLFHVEGEGMAMGIELCKIWLLNIHGLKITKLGNCDGFISALISRLGW
ncbi:hypothetical protein HDV01_001108 [Terramyces sp. JEL0728]|nr:hypothetical protein HDV01_001108 [Terramyces sp. JEL0728]